MTRTIGKLADRLLSAVVPQTTARAEYEYSCVYRASCGCWILQARYCSSGCSQWYDYGYC